MQEIRSRPDGGNLKAFGRMDGAPILCIEMAQNKAYTALFGVSTQDFFNFIKDDRRFARKGGLSSAPDSSRPIFESGVRYLVVPPWQNVLATAPGTTRSE